MSLMIPACPRRVQESRHTTCSCEHDGTAWIGDYFDTVACDHCEEYRKSGLSPSSTKLMNYLTESGLTGKTLLDLGCGSGRFSIEALKNGVESIVGVDLSNKMITLARELASERGVASRAEFRVGDAAKQEAPTCDIVVLDKVVCCYPQIDHLLSKASTNCRDRIGIILPREAGIAKVPVRLGVYLDNLVSWLQRDPSRMYLHSIRRMHDTLRKAGFELMRESSSGWFWMVLLYRKA